MQSRQREIRFNTMVTRKNVFSVKTGRPVAFLTAMPRFQETPRITIEPEKEQKQKQTKETQEKTNRKPMTKKRLEQIAMPKNPLPKIVSHKVNVFEPLPQPTKEVDFIELSEEIADELKASTSPPTTLSLI